MPETLGNIFIHAAFVVATYAIVMSVLGARTNQYHLVRSGRNAVWATGILVLSAVIALEVCLLKGRFHVEYVHQYTNLTMPIFYKIAALWGGQNGSLLFWLFILMVYSSCAVFQTRHRNVELQPYVVAVLMTIALFFITLLIFSANPFQTMPFDVRDGRGLNPLLQNYYMLIHPPSLYLGYVGMSVPFAFGIAAMIANRLDNKWIIEVRIWTLIAWFFLSIGNLLGASWAYEVLGWGGYWAWDPVENAAFIPWLTATAFLHSAIIQEKRNMLKTWNMALVILSFLMTMVGTFLTRSGIVSSVHSFAQSDVGQYFFVFLGICILVSFGLLILRLPSLRSTNVLDSLVSRESAFLFNNLVFVGAAFAILWGTLFPVLSEWVRGTKITVGPPYFNSVMIPIGLVLLFLTGFGPIVGWRKSTLDQLKKSFLVPILFVIPTSVLALIFLRKSGDFLTTMYVNISISLCVFVFVTIVMEYWEGIAMRARIFKEDFMTALIRLIASNRRRYGGYVVHIGIVLLFLGFTGNAFKVEKELKLKPQETTQFENYLIHYDSLVPTSNAHKTVISAHLAVWKNDKPYALMKPARVLYNSSVPGEDAQPSTEIAIKRSIVEDLYFALLTFDPENQTIFVKAVINPLVQFIWIGGLFLILGSVVVMWPGANGLRRTTYA
ncbi:MAG: heme lyase CcmF/NrfE family subunit [Bdellovibrionales bacterium]|nr:heme lyase CcmF/NrfE family subunit [Bdellovibrionales bacterium]